MNTYATPQQLQDYLDQDTLPEDATRLLRRATELVDDYIVTAIYDVDTAGAPTDPTIATALTDATCAQVEYWLTGDEEDDILGPTQGMALASMQEQYGAGTNRATPMYLAPRATRHLRRAGLMNGAVHS